MAITPIPRFQSSELSRNARAVFAAAEEQPVDVTRRDGDDLVLMSKREADSREQLLQLAAQLIAVSTDDRGTLGDRMAQVFPWMLALSGSDREQCAKDLLSTARASFATGHAHLAAAELVSWRESATAIADGLAIMPVDWLETGIVVERP
ncbi:prevent-host-death protein [Rathayibacter festucae]|uniref:prevent-host-death protein n=1 Tax=Rathayibacter festucae TaxID=110937 RepID=UPI002A6A8436|nr:prevent-host-death protein [Rathayibacter festucae]MDY0913150.1 prevent-host-death protein [Rathayibacter festucae]